MFRYRVPGSHGDFNSKPGNTDILIPSQELRMTSLAENGWVREVGSEALAGLGLKVKWRA